MIAFVSSYFSVAVNIFVFPKGNIKRKIRTTKIDLKRKTIFNNRLDSTDKTWRNESNFD